ncbi:MULTISPECIES: hypothetical protein [Actinomycetes]|uniref:Uncharacterized protein n=2 Tax=Actinomycetes TaxID=1760 RepID=A0ABP6LVB4_9MICC|nr:hypothetical protein [Nesterenkonia sp. CL21]MDS2172232.1 hypothetical protein [Nesterenkonia sp. CL21]
MPWFAWIVLTAIIVGGIVAVVTARTERGIGAPGDREELEQLKRRLSELERRPAAPELEEPHIPTRAEENLTAEDRWRLDMLEARLESLEGSTGRTAADADERNSGEPDSDEPDDGDSGHPDGFSGTTR